MKFSFFLLLILMLRTGIMHGQNEQNISKPEKIHNITQTPSVEKIDELKKTKIIKPIEQLSNDEITTCQASIVQLEAQVIDQKIVIQSQEMLIEQIMKRLEILEKKYKEEPLDIVSNMFVKEER